MTDHEPLCLSSTVSDCICAELSMARADERQQYQGRRDDMMRALSGELLNIRTDLRAKVEALTPENVYSHRGPVILRADVLDLFDGGSDDLG